MTFDPATIPSMIAKMITLLETKCIPRNGAPVNWRALFSDQPGVLKSSASPQQFEQRVNRILTSGGLSHVAFFHASAERAPARYALNATFCVADGADGPRWMFQDVHEGGPAHAAGLRPGNMLLSVDGTAVAPPILPTFGLGKDSLLTVANGAGGVRPVTVVLPKPDPKGKGKGKPPMAEPTSVTSQVIDGGVGYARVAFFPGANGQRFARDLTRALSQLGSCSRLIVDMRGNLGGFVGSLRLMSYLTPGRVPIGYSMTKRGQDRGLRRDQLPCLDKLPGTKLEMLQMALRFMVLNRDRSVRLMTEGLGPQPFHGRVVMLINEHTASAGEMVAAFAAENKLAVLVGTTTAGQVLGGANFPVGQGFVLRLPAAGWYTWSGDMIEGCGVSPTTEAPLEINALREGRDNQLEQALKIVAEM